jgi:hypothetical protein
VRSTNIGGCEVLSGSWAKPYREPVSRECDKRAAAHRKKFLFNVKVSRKMKCRDEL